MDKKLLPTFLLTAMATGCSLAPYQGAPVEEISPQSPAKGGALHLMPPDGQQLKQKLYSQHREWKGIPYRLGGLSKRGIDCSGLVYTTYRDQLGIELPRTTEYQAQVGTAIRRTDLRPGDLVFFKTGHKVRHVGIYLEGGKFFHASTSRGVTISRLDGYYWRDRYWQARRVDLDTEGLAMGK
ncbi:NlpC/P60 family protein [Microbulbifer guangxiensis]|uniref:NlpC/P60 family protein n=1 Tax=Microbulbifer guangxiensis TaxID=2904249 RepID=UPI001F2CD973|nr:NlpC/P60 family protein [Microbulbifer guangxiensis]